MLRGKSKANWSTGGSKSREHHDGREVYLDVTQYLFGSRGAEPLQVPIGIHRYEFEIQLPPNLPASLDLPRGSIRYSLEARLDVPWSLNREFKVDLKIIRKDDYSAINELKVPRIIEEEIDTSTCFTSSLPLQATVSIPYSVFTPGSQIPITFHLDNPGKFDVERIHVNFKRYSDFHRLEKSLNLQILMWRFHCTSKLKKSLFQL